MIAYAFISLVFAEHEHTIHLTSSELSVRTED